MRQKVKVTNLTNQEVKEITFIYSGGTYKAEYNGNSYVEEVPGTEVIYNGSTKRVVKNVHVIFVDGIGFTIYKAGVGELKIMPEKGYRVNHYMLKKALIFGVALFIFFLIIFISSIL